MIHVQATYCVYLCIYVLYLVVLFVNILEIRMNKPFACLGVHWLIICCFVTAMIIFASPLQC